MNFYLTFKENGNQLRKDILQGKYRPKSVRRAEISKSDRGVRLLGIPTVTDRMIKTSHCPTANRKYLNLSFLDNSYSFMPNRNAHQAIEKARQYINEGYTWVVDIDLEKYFDTVNHDKLMSLVAREVKDKRVSKLIRAYLNSGVMINGVVIETDKGFREEDPLALC